MSLNHKRRIFRPNAARSVLPPGLIPGRRTLMAVAGGAAMLLTGTWLIARPSEAPAQGPAIVRLVANAGQVAVMDGATLRLAERVVRLDGISAPARGTSCGGAGAAEVDCGVASANALAALVRGNAVDCSLRLHEDNGRSAAVCVARGQELNRAQVLAGWARADGALGAEEQRAREARRGVWAGEPAGR